MEYAIILKGFHGRDQIDISEALARCLLRGEAVRVPGLREKFDSYCPSGCWCGGPALALVAYEPGREEVWPLQVEFGAGPKDMLVRIMPEVLAWS